MCTNLCLGQTNMLLLKEELTVKVTDIYGVQVNLGGECDKKNYSIDQKLGEWRQILYSTLMNNHINHQ